MPRTTDDRSTLMTTAADQVKSDEPPVKGTGEAARLAAQSFRTFKPMTCVICATPLSIHEQAVGKTCGKSDCKDRYLRNALQRQLVSQNELRSRAVAIRASIAKRLGIAAPTQLVLGVLPSNDRRLMQSPKRRIRKFADRLMEVISKAAAIHLGNVEPDDYSDAYDTPLAATADQLAVLGNGCAACRGHCCSQGAEHAFISVETILRHMQSHPDQRPRDVLDAYLSRVGDRTYEDSCVYHARTGCRLPREMRSKVCNGYLCKGLDQMLHQLDNRSTNRAFVVATSGQEILRGAVIDPEGLDVFERESMEDASPAAIGGEID